MSFWKIPRISTTFCWLVSFSILIFGSVQFIECQNQFDDYNGFQNPSVLQLLTQLVYGQLSNLSSSITQELGTRSSFCFKNAQADWNNAFNFSSNLDFLSACIVKTNGDATRRLCTGAEVNFYFDSVLHGSGNTAFLKLNNNCNLSRWVSGCEPGWACSIGPTQQVDLKNSKIIPSRTYDCQTCCEGFFCPQGLTCMIPCPLGSYCPLATQNETTGVCEPYSYQLPPGQPNHTCGGANIWTDFGTSSEIFCSAGSYCPTSTERISCSSGHYCRTGSTSEKPCFKLTSCNSNTANQNIHAYGVLILMAVTTLLLIIYNCSDQVLTTRERRRAKSRETAAKSARATIKARQRWKAAKDAARRHTSGLQVQLSQTFSFKKSSEQNSEKLRILNQGSLSSDLYPNQHPSTSRESLTSSGTKTEQNDIMKVVKDIENDPESYEGFSFGSGNESVIKHNSQPGKQGTDSQVFRYAYAQLEKEKAQQQENHNLTFSGVINMATSTEIKKRPLIEISFKDLTLTLKGKKKHLLRCVTGKIKPGHITAVMGPSGAGKTTLISALAGKTIGCHISGSILINGRNDSIHSFRKIMGFVPQDDIVHGNLTVEENLWFSAVCRLSADSSKADKVLIVERVIEFLGLQSVRSSLVGTVEKRGVSGGQRKRVNVGLEMVMEPSVLILDEPTSGLDSASSQLLLRALRREALAGVNICMVVHQPSYALFKMFDDLILLAKGGFTVYHGPARNVEGYFSGLGITIPERVNPPDHFIDILEGIVLPSKASEVSYKELPVRWMIHSGYSIPPDLKPYGGRFDEPLTGVTNPTNEVDHAGAEMGEQSFAGELWQEVRSNVEHHRDKIRLNFLKTKDLSNRRTPGIFQQCKYFLGRVGKQRLREARLQSIDYLILLLAGACLGSITNVSDQSFGAPGYTYTIIAVSLLCMIAALRTFSLDRLHYWRESSSGMSSLAYFLSKDTIDHFNSLIKPALYLSMFYSFTYPRSSFADNYVILLCLVYCVTGIAYALAIVFQPGAAQLWSVLLPVVLTLFATQTKRSVVIKNLANFCYPKWALEAFVIANAERYGGVWLITRCGSLQRSGYDLHDWGLCILILLLIGSVSRVIAYLCMLTFQRK